MTFAPPTLVALGKYLVDHGAVNLGIVGDAAHVGTGTSYHLGKSALSPTAYSRTHPRDKAGLSEAASAIDIGKIGGTLPNLQAFSNWLSSQCQRRAIDTLDIREVIYSPDGVKVLRWDEPSQTVYQGGTGTGQGDDSHRTHTHVSFYRDAEFRDHTALFRRYFEEDEVNLTKVVAQRWTANGTNGALRTAPDRGLPVAVRVPAGGEIISYGEYKAADGNNWRAGDWPIGSGTPMWFLRTGPGIAPDHDFIAGELLTLPCPPSIEPIDCAPLVNAARAEGVAAGLRDGSRAVKDAAVNAAVLYGG